MWTSAPRQPLERGDEHVPVEAHRVEDEDQ